MSELREECGVAAIYHLPGAGSSALVPEQGPEEVSRLMTRMLLDIQNRGQLAAGFTSYNPHRRQLIDTHKDVGTVSEVFRLSHRGKYESLMKEYSGRAAIGHVRYATCGEEDRSYAQPFERHHIKKHKWFTFAFNGQLANYSLLRDELLGDSDNYLARESDTEIFMHMISKALSRESRPPLIDLCRQIAERADGAYSLVFLNALGDMLVARDPLGIKPLSYAVDGPLFAAASESVALLNLGFASENIQSLLPGQAITITDGNLQIERFADSPRHAHCFFEWVYFSNVASTLDRRGVYMARKALGEELARMETLPIDEDTIVVPVPDTSKAAADSMAYSLGVPCLEGLIRNRYSGRTFIEGGAKRAQRAQTKYTPLREVLEGKRVLLVEDSIVRSTTMRVLLKRIRQQGLAREIHVRVACPPIIAPCFYGIDMSTISELFAPHFLKGHPLTRENQEEMARTLGADSLRYLPVESIARAIRLGSDHLCQACITGEYPTEHGQRLAQIALENHARGLSQRTYEKVGLPAAAPATS
ncbi:MAG: amidophosphoribosyltransferase [Pirellulales bacterium]|jgi:amidophosphoribosyltransferase|nr:amidophosphoribosyltransferase [Thermoguttaceae bacterium]MDD4787994.1 amidophosphoribosyltransferase [Pirellulales bacterium]MDI9444675.1 amidophosphoribosyltransferase [Planctomycetota bacterium]NLZ02313.1 amidophosphoribosyltransferase [Pirellulaceae bacterium]